MQNPFKKKEEEVPVANEETVSLVSGESYVLFNNLRGRIVIWVNCDKEMVVKLSMDEFKKTFYSIFPNLNISDMLFYLNRGDYVFTDKLTVKPLHPKIMETESPVPTLKDAISFVNQQRRSSLSYSSPFRIL